jgi:hypothetical protein
MEESIAIVYCTREKTGESNEFIEHLKNTCECNCHVYAVHNPDGVSLSRIYSDMLGSPDIQDNVIIFIHDDIEFLRKGWGKEILRLFNEHKDYGIIGVAGSAQFDSNAAWWNYEKKFGQVLHRSEGKSWLTSFSPLLDKDLQEVVVIDGLFIAVQKDRIAESFSKDIEAFDFYDIYFCLANHFSKDWKYKIGVTTNIRIAHNSVGKLKDSWYKNREIINNKFGEHYPIDILKK